MFTRLIPALALTAALAATPALAGPQDAMADKAMKAKTMQDADPAVMSEEAKELLMEERKMDAMRRSDTVVLDGVETGETIIVEEPVMDDTMMKEKMMAKEMMDDGTMVDPAPVDAPAVTTTTTVNCPAGTEAQADGTCMITGDFQF